MLMEGMKLFVYQEWITNLMFFRYDKIMTGTEKLISE